MRTDKPKPLFKVSLFWVIFVSIFIGLTTPSYATMYGQSTNPQIKEGIRDALSRIPDAELKRLLIQQFDAREELSPPIDQSDVPIEIESKSTPIAPSIHHRALTFFEFIGQSFYSVPTSLKLVISSNQLVGLKQTKQHQALTFNIVLPVIVGTIAMLVVYGLWRFFLKHWKHAARLKEPIFYGTISPRFIKFMCHLILLGVFSFTAKLFTVASGVDAAQALKNDFIISVFGLVTFSALLAYFIFISCLSSTDTQRLTLRKARELTIISMVISILFIARKDLYHLWAIGNDKQLIVDMNILVVSLIMVFSAGPIWHYRRIFSGWLTPGEIQNEGNPFTRFWPITIAVLIVLDWLFFLYSSSMAPSNLVVNTKIFCTIIAVGIFPFADRVLVWKTCEILSNIFPQDSINEDNTYHRDLFNAISNILRVVLLICLIALICILWQIDVFQHMNAPQGSSIVFVLLGLVLILFSCYILWQTVTIYVSQRLLKEKLLRGGEELEVGGEGGAAAGSRWETLLPILGYTVKTSIIVIGVFSGLTHLGINVAPLIAGAGILGLAIGFGSQTLVKDIVSGFFFLLDDAFRMGEFVDVGGGVTGTIEKIAIRSLL